MPPTPAPTADQIDDVQEIAHLYSPAQTETLINNLDDVRWAKTVADIAEWAKHENKQTIINGNGVDINKDRNRREITIRVRRRLGVFPADPNESSTGGGYCSYTPKHDDADCCLFE